MATAAHSYPRLFRFGTAWLLWQSTTPARALSINGQVVKASPQAWRHAEIDYSAANEFIRSYYGDSIEQPYFPVDGKIEPIYNARNGFWNDDLARPVPPSLSQCGFVLQHAPTAVTDFHDLDQIHKIYLPELRQQIYQTFDNSHRITDIIFWFPIYRNETQLVQDSMYTHGVLASAPVAPLAHIDTDVGAYKDASGIIGLVDKNRINDRYQLETYDARSLEKALQAGRRFAIVNTWRNACFQQPILRAPLALLATQYNNPRPCFPDAKPDPLTSRWYTFPGMSARDECLLFLQYDRLVQQPSDLWHCALTSIRQPGALPRRSLDIRAFVVFDEYVAPEQDRFASNRLRPLLSEQESEVFCKEQGEVERNKARAQL